MRWVGLQLLLVCDFYQLYCLWLIEVDHDFPDSVGAFSAAVSIPFILGLNSLNILGTVNRLWHSILVRNNCIFDHC